MQERIDRARAQLALEQQQAQQRAQEEKQRQDIEDAQYIEKITNDPRYLAMLQAAHDPLLDEALAAYFKRFPQMESKTSMRQTIFGLSVSQGEVLTPYKLTIRCSPYEIGLDGRPSKHPKSSQAPVGEIMVNGIRIYWFETHGTSSLNLDVVTEYGNDYSNGDYVTLHSVEAFADLVAESIAGRGMLVGLSAT